MDMFTFFWFFIMPIVGLIMCVVFPVVFGLLWFKWLPPISKTLYRAKRKRLIPLFLTHDSGRASCVLVYERKGEGVLMTDDGRYKILPRYVGTEDAGNPEPKKVSKIYSDFITKRALLTGLGLPILYGYSGTLCALNPEALALVESGDMILETADMPVKAEKAKNKSLKELLRPLMILDPRKIKEVLNSSYDESQIGACLVDSEMIGMLGRPSQLKKYIPLFLILGILVVGAIAVLMVPDLLGGVMP